MSFSDSRPPTPAEIGVRGEPKACGGCTLCCKVLGIGPNGKAPGALCEFAVVSSGCSVHPTRPGNCRGFQCIWTLAEPLGEDWRPDRAGFLISPRPDPAEIQIVLDPDLPAAWRREPYHSQIMYWASLGEIPVKRVLLRLDGRVVVVFPEAEIDLGRPIDPHFRVESGYEVREGRRQPFARFANRYGALPEVVMDGRRR